MCQKNVYMNQAVVIKGLGNDLKCVFIKLNHQ